MGGGEWRVVSGGWVMRVFREWRGWSGVEWSGDWDDWGGGGEGRMLEGTV